MFFKRLYYKLSFDSSQNVTLKLYTVALNKNTIYSYYTQT